MRSPSSTARAIGIATGVTVLLALLVTWFSWPAKELEPRDLPVVVAAPGPAGQQIAGQLEAARPGAFEVTVVADEAAADAALRDRSAYAAFVAGPGGLSLHTASAASPTVAALLTQAAQQLGAQSGSAVTVVDVVPGAPGDPRGAGFASGYLPLVLASMVAGIVLSVLVRARVARLVGLAAYAVLAGLVGAGRPARARSGQRRLPGGGRRDRAARAGGERRRGRAGRAARAGRHRARRGCWCSSSATRSPAWPPPRNCCPSRGAPIGQFLPAGAGATLLRSAAFFDGAGSAAALWTLAGWSVVGLALVWLGRASLPGPDAPTATTADTKETVAA